MAVDAPADSTNVLQPAQLNQRTEPTMSKKGQPWTEAEHLAFLSGLKKLGKGNWRGISKYYVPSRTPTQVASHAQKHFLRLSGSTKRKSRFAALEGEVGYTHAENGDAQPSTSASTSAPTTTSEPAAQQQHGQAQHQQQPQQQQHPFSPPPCLFPPMFFPFPGHPPFFPPFMCPPPPPFAPGKGMFFPVLPTQPGAQQQDAAAAEPAPQQQQQPASDADAAAAATGKRAASTAAGEDEASTSEPALKRPCRPAAVHASSGDDAKHIVEQLAVGVQAPNTLNPSMHSAFRAVVQAVST